MKAKIEVIVTLKDPAGVWTNIQEIEAVDSTLEERTKSIGAKCVLVIAEILGHGGILEMTGSLTWKFIPLQRVVDIQVKAVEQLIESATLSQTKLIRDPNMPLLFRNTPSKGHN